MIFLNHKLKPKHTGEKKETKNTTAHFCRVSGTTERYNRCTAPLSALSMCG